MSAITCEVFIFHITEFLDLLGQDFVEAFLHASKCVPSDKNLRRALIEAEKWKYYKEKVQTDVLVDKYNRKNSFDHQLRKPAMVPHKQTKPRQGSVSPDGG